MARRKETDEEKEAKFLEIIKKLERVSDADLAKALNEDGLVTEYGKRVAYLIRNSATICEQFKKATSNYITDLDDICLYDLYGFYYLIIRYLDSDLAKQVYEFCCEGLDKEDCTFLYAGEPKNDFLKKAIDWINQREELDKYGVKCCIVTLLDGAEYLLLKYPKHKNNSYEHACVREMVSCNCKIHEYFLSVYNEKFKKFL